VRKPLRALYGELPESAHRRSLPPRPKMPSLLLPKPGQDIKVRLASEHVALLEGGLVYRRFDRTWVGLASVEVSVGKYGQPTL